MSARKAACCGYSTIALIAAAVSLLASCGGGGGGSGPAMTYSVGATTSGLSGTGLVLQLNGGSNLAITGNGSATFASTLASGTSYAVTVATQPASPSQQCTVANGSGTMGAADVNVAVACVTKTFTIGVTASGLTGQGLVLQLNGGDNLAIAADGSATFSNPLDSGANYAVTVLTAPTGQACTVANGSGTVGSANITNITVSCGVGYSVSVTVSGLAGSTLVLALNSGKQVALTSNGTETFSTLLPSGSAYAVTVVTQPVPPPTQNCTVANGSGTVGNANVTVTAICVPTYAVGVTVSGLAGTGLTLELNGGAPLSITAPGNATFPTLLASGANYAVTVKTQPNTPSQTCTVANGSGTIGTANVTNVVVVCPLIYSPPAKGDWTLMTPPATFPTSADFGVYGTQGIASAANSPGVRSYGSSWTDAAGNLWLFGGYGLAGSLGDLEAPLNDLWRYNPSTAAWTWVSGSNAQDASGVYGTQGTPAASNVPGARADASSWIDAAGNLWLFGGSGVASPNLMGDLNDLWKYNIATGLWTWVSGSNTPYASGVYGSQGTPAPGNVPGARSGSTSWIDGQGNLWLFAGYSEQGPPYALNDLWEFSPTSGLWTWESGSVGGTMGSGPSGVYGTKGTGAANNVPGGRDNSVSWFGKDGNLWLFGGYGLDSTGTSGALNDLWKYNPTTGFWTWVGGSDLANANGVYGTKGTASSSNIPGGRDSAFSWIDSAGNFWLFGGSGFPASGAQNSLNDLWEYNRMAANWSWVSGTDVILDGGTKGTPGVSSPSNLPSARALGVSWIDTAGNLWLFGGEAYGPEWYNDLWVYTPLAP